MKPVKQEDSYGCGLACLAFILNTEYSSVIKAFKKGNYKAKNIGVTCRELASFLSTRGLKYEWKYIKPRIRKRIYTQGVLVFIKRSKRYPAGHYLTRYEDKWMDSWINFPDLNIRAGFRNRLPGKPIYAIMPSPHYLW